MLQKEFGTLEDLKKATMQELIDLPGIGLKRASEIIKELKRLKI